MNNVSPFISGMIAPVCTPVTENFDVDAASLERLLGFLLEGSLDGVFVLGSTSEVALLTDRQRRRVIEVATSTVAGQVPVLAGIIDTATDRVIDHARAAINLGADALVATAPFYVRAHPDEVREHYRAIRQAIDRPLIAYDIPVAVGQALDRDLVLELAAESTIDAFKDSSGDYSGLRTMLRPGHEIPGFSIFTGQSVLVDAAMYMGADGVVSGLANVDPHGHSRLYRAALDGKWDEARVEQEHLNRLYTAIIGRGDPGRSKMSVTYGAFKAALMLRGIISSCTLLRPLTQVSRERVDEIRIALQKLDELA